MSASVSNSCELNHVPLRQDPSAIAQGQRTIA
uniref:Uncharacterized protein n=1 Tax=Physcomitrium patens TaxID=3218 RepID=A0A2K1KNI2_PHYPA|nr:hypothetical protein PHYPA_006218 [Physcomitrium patens]